MGIRSALFYRDGADDPPYDVQPYDVQPYDVQLYDVPPYDVPPYDVPPYDVPPYDVPPYDVPPSMSRRRCSLSRVSAIMTNQMDRIAVSVAAIVCLVMVCGMTASAQSPDAASASEPRRLLNRPLRFLNRQNRDRRSVPVSVVDDGEESQVPADSPEPADGPATEDGERLDPRQEKAIDMAHAATFAGDPFPSAEKCRNCHPGHYREWASSQHAYAQLSPVFNTMQNLVNQLTNGTNADFCIRCHTHVGMALEEPLAMSQMDRHPASREGVTCVVCHRVDKNWGKGSGRRALVAGDLSAAIYGPTGNAVLSRVLADPEKFGALSGADRDPDSRSRTIHGEVVPRFFQSTPSMCGSCHDVLAPNGFRLEDAFSEFKSSPAAREKEQNCQTCHMGKIPGCALRLCL